MRLRRPVLSALACAHVLTLLFGFAEAEPAAAETVVLTAAPESAVTVGPLAQLGACLKQRRIGDVLFVIDRSASLRDTDPAGARVTGAQLVLDKLLADSSEAKIELTVALTGFDASLGTEADWTALTPQNEGALTSKIASFATQDDGIETDYWTALTQARAKLSRHAAAAGTGKPCQAMLLFTDGRYELQARNTPELRSQYGMTKQIPGVQEVEIDDDAAVARVVRAGQADICRTGGVADELRSDGVTLIAVGLQSAASAGTRDFSFLRRVAENPQRDCGRQVANGYFVQAGAVDELIFAFNSINLQNKPLPPVKRRVCRISECPQEAHNFTLDASIKKINLLGAVNADGVTAYLKLPGHASLPLSYTSAVKQLVVGSTRLTVRWSKPRSLVIDASYGGAAAWSGPWSLTFVDPTGDHPDAVSQTQLTISGDLQAVLAAPTKPAQAGEESSLTLSLTRRDGTPTDLGNPAPSVRVSVSAAAVGSMDDPQVVVEQLPVTASTTRVRWAIPAGFPGTQARLTVVLSVRTVSGQALEDAVTYVGFDVAAPLGYPHLATDTVAFPRADGRTAVRSGLTVTGPGCVWVDGSTMEAFPAGTEATTVTSAHGDSAHCLRLSEQQDGSLPLTLKPGAQGNGDLQGRITVHLAPDGHPERAQAVSVKFIGSQQRLPKEQIRWLVLVASMFLGIGIPLLVLFGLRRRTARFPGFTPTSTLVDVVLSEASLAMADGSPVPKPALWRDDPEITGSRREATVSGLTVRARAGLRLQQAGYAIVIGGGAGVGSQPPHQATGEHLPVLPLQLRGGWALFFNPSAMGDKSRAKLLLIVGPQASPVAMAQEMSNVFAAAVRDAPELARAMRGIPDKDTAAGASGGGSPFDSAPASAHAAAGPFQAADSGPWGSGSGGFGAAGQDAPGPFGGRDHSTGDSPPGPLGNYPRDSR